LASLLLMSSLFLNPTLQRQERQANLGLTPILYPEISLKTGKMTGICNVLTGWHF